MSKFEETDTPRKALLYCRASGRKQIKDGSGLSSQEHRCRQYATAKGYEVEEVFPDVASGGGDFMKRPGMVALLRYLDDHPIENYVVIFDDLKRYSRDVEFHLKLRRLMKERNATRECLNFNFEDSPEGKFSETISAAAGEYERETMGRQNLQKSIARVEQGYCVQSTPPIGYQYEKAATGGMILVRDEPAASIVQEALEGYACGRYSTAAEVARFFTEHPQFPKKGKSGEITRHSATRILTQKLYAGIVGVAAWGVTDRKGMHEGLISVAAYNRIQERLARRSHAPARKDLNIDFPLRGAVACCDCESPLTAGWSTNKVGKKYPYYYCYNRTCGMYGKSIQRAKIESEFLSLLQQVQPTQTRVAIAKIMFRKLWDAQHGQMEDMSKALKREAKQLERKIEQLVDAVVEATNPRVISAYEKRIAQMERKALILKERKQKMAKPPGNFEDVLEHAVQFLSSPCKIWVNGSYTLKRLVLKLTFSGHLKYGRQTGFRTPKTALPFNMLAGFFGQDLNMVPRR